MMLQYDRIELGRKAKDLRFVRDTFEKVCRLIDVLEFFEKSPLLSKKLALKGGTAINLTIFNLPRLSVDIDLDFTENVAREELLDIRKAVKDEIHHYMAANGYAVHPNSKAYHALDSMVFAYENSGGMRDNIKVEINYMLRSHILPLTKRTLKMNWMETGISVLTVNPIEIFASKIVALSDRAAPRDLYDVYNMLRNGLFNEQEKSILRKCFVFYSAIGQKAVPSKVDFSSMDRITQNRIKTDLAPVLRSGEFFELKGKKEMLKTALYDMLKMEPNEMEFWNNFRKKKYSPELLFEDASVLERLTGHPMALWKMQNRERDLSR